MKILYGLGLAVIIYLIWQYLELKKFEVTEYKIASAKIEREMHIMMLSDLHGNEYGKENCKLVEEIRKRRPDLILIPGDMIVSKKVRSFHVSESILCQLVKIAPVYLANGNHESKSKLGEDKNYTNKYMEYESACKKLGVHILNNDKEIITLGKNSMMICGLEIDLSCYKKGKNMPLDENFLVDHLQYPKEIYTILMAHNPAYSEQYVKWGADLTVCGHNHGGLVRIPFVGSIISPQFKLFPKYDAGQFSFGSKHVIIGRGLGTHTFHIRIFNRAELVSIRVIPKVEN